MSEEKFTPLEGATVMGLVESKALGRKPDRAGANMANIEADGVTIGTINASAVSEMICELNLASSRVALRQCSGNNNLDAWGRAYLPRGIEA